MALRVEPRPHGGGPALTVLRVEQRQASGRGVVDGVDRAAGRSDPLEHVARHRREQSVGAREASLELRDRSGVDGAAASRGRGVGQRDTEVVRAECDGGVDGVVGRRRQGAQTSDRTAPRAVTAATLERERREHSVDPAGAQAPVARHPRLDVARLDAQRSEHGGERRVAGVAQHHPREPVPADASGDLRGERVERQLACAVHAGHGELGAEVHQQLVATRRHPVDQVVDGLGARQLIGAHLDQHREEEPQRRARVDGPVLDRSCRGAVARRRRCGRSRSGGRGWLRSRRIRLVGRLVGQLDRFGVLVERRDHQAVRLDVLHEHFGGAGGAHRERALRQVRDGGLRAEPDLDDAFDTEAALGDGSDQQVLCLDPPHG